MKVEFKIEVDIPIGHKVIRYDKAKTGDFFINEYDIVEEWVYQETSGNKYIILEKTDKQGEMLVGCLCGVSNFSLELAKVDICNFGFVGIIKNYSDGLYEVAKKKWKYAYPVSQEQLIKLATKIGE